MTVLNTVLPVITLILGYIGTTITDGRKARRDLIAADRRAGRDMQIQALREIPVAMIEVIHYVNVLLLGVGDSNDSFSPATGYIAALHKLEVRRARQGSVEIDSAVRRFLELARPLMTQDGRASADASLLSMLSDSLFETNELVRKQFVRFGVVAVSD